MTTSIQSERIEHGESAPLVEGGPLRMLLQRRMPAMLRRHYVRSVLRVIVLLASDIAMFLLLRVALRVVRDGMASATPGGEYLREYLPRGYLGGWAFVTALVVGLMFAGAYGRGDYRRDAVRLFKGAALGVALSLWASIWTLGPAQTLLQFSLTVVAIWVSLTIERYLVDVAVARVYPHRAGGVLFVGDRGNPETRKMHDTLVAGNRVHSLGWVMSVAAPSDGAEGYVGSIDGIWSILDETRAETVILCGDLNDAAFESVLEASSSAGCQVFSLARQRGVARPGLVWHEGIPFVELTVPALQAQQLFLKRILDMVGSVLGLVLFAPIFLIVAVAIMIDSGRPIFFWQERVGYGGKVFHLVKFRTMRPGADAEKEGVAHMNPSGDARLFKVPNDPRVTRVGAFLRRWSLDELPQLWNTLRGDMSLVGPRPFFESDLAGYMDHHFQRLGAKPGITGLWQVKGRSSVVDFEEVVQLDREYIYRWSIALDLWILLQTLPAVLRRTGAY